jgi:hypothetical protein
VTLVETPLPAGHVVAALLYSEVQGVVNMASDEPASITAAVERLRYEVGRRAGRTLEQEAADTIAWCRRAVRAP